MRTIPHLNNKNLAIKQALIGWAFLLGSAVVATTLSVWLSANGLKDGPSIGVSIAVTGIPAAGLFLFLLQREQAPVEPVTMILTALVAGASVAAKDAASQTVEDSYNGLKVLIQRRFAEKPTAQTALAEYEKDPDTWKKPLEKSLVETNVIADKEVLKQAQQVLKLVNP